MTLTADAVAGYAYAAGLRGNTVATAVAIAKAESSFNERDHNSTPPDDSYGLWQINLYKDLGPPRRQQFHLKADSDLLDPGVNARAMYLISGGGNSWTPWSTFTNGAYRKYLTEATAAANAVNARSGAAVASGAPPLEANAGTIAGEVLPPGGNLGFNVAAVSPVFPTFDLPGSNQSANLALMGVSGEVSLSVNSVAQITLVFPDPLGPMQSWLHLLPHAGAKLNDLDMICAGGHWGDGGGGVLTYTATLRPAGVEYLRGTDTHSAGASWSNMSPTQVLAERAAAAGLRFYGKGTAQRSNVTRLGFDDVGKKLAESDWDMGQRFAREEGFWFFESAGALYFAPPTWLAQHATLFDVRYNSTDAERIWETIGIPDAGWTLDGYPYGIGAITRTITFDLPRWRGEQVRPGMQCVFKGIPGMDETLDGLGHPALYIVTNVRWSFDGGTTSASIELTEARDPVPQPAADDGTAGGSDADASSPGSATSPGPSSSRGALVSASGSAYPTGTGVSNMGKGSYGLQYNAVGGHTATGSQPGAVVLMNHLTSKFKSSTNNGIFDPRNVDGTSSLSAHAEGRAGDLGVPLSSNYGDSIAAYLAANASLFGVQVVIWNKRIWTSRDSTWRTYTPANGKTDASSEHRNHIHWELCWEAARYLNDNAIRGAITE